MRDLVDYIARALVDEPAQVEVKQERLGGNRVRVELRVAKRDVGRVIGRNGRVANAIRTLLRVAAAREGKQASLDVVDPR